MKLIFAHEHLINITHVGDKIIPVLAKLIYRTTPRKIFRKILHNIIFWTDKDELDRIANMLENMGKTQEENWNELKTWMSKGDEAWILTIDQEFMERGKVPTPYRQQIKEVCDLIDKGEPIKLFVHIDPRRSDFMSLIKEFQEYICGIKMYPYMGYFPYDIRLNPLWRKCESEKWPVIWHCSPTNINWYGGKDIDKILKHSMFPLIHKKNNNKHKSTNFSNPKGIIEVAKITPNVDHVIAHLGGGEEVERWLNGEKETFTEEIIFGCEEYENIYTDTAFTCYNKKMFEAARVILKRIPKKVIFGTDFSMNKSVAYMKNYVVDFRKYLGDKLFYQMSKNASKLVK